MNQLRMDFTETSLRQHAIAVGCVGLEVELLLCAFHEGRRVELTDVTEAVVVVECKTRLANWMRCSDPGVGKAANRLIARGVASESAGRPWRLYVSFTRLWKLPQVSEQPPRFRASAPQPTPTDPNPTQPNPTPRERVVSHTYSKRVCNVSEEISEVSAGISSDVADNAARCFLRAVEQGAKAWRELTDAALTSLQPDVLGVLHRESVRTRFLPAEHASLLWFLAVAHWSVSERPAGSVKRLVGRLKRARAGDRDGVPQESHVWAKAMAGRLHTANQYRQRDRLIARWPEMASASR
jgi:hypothetical protein